MTPGIVGSAEQSCRRAARTSVLREAGYKDDAIGRMIESGAAMEGGKP